jgi:small subunit ribosomal protein S9
MNETNLYTGLGKRKTSVAKAFLKVGNGNITVNNKKFEDFFNGIVEDAEIIKNPFILVNILNDYDVNISVKGGGTSSQIDAIKLAIAKAICQINEEYRPILSKNSLLNRDSRIKERKKYGLKKARKASQYSKR